MPLAKEALLETANYIRNEFGKIARVKFMQEVKKTSRQIGDNPYIGKIEPLLEKLPDGYRSMVVKRIYKIVYRIEENTVEVSDFWNCRRNPDALSARIV